MYFSIRSQRRTRSHFSLFLSLFFPAFLHSSPHVVLFYFCLLSLLALLLNSFSPSPFLSFLSYYPKISFPSRPFFSSFSQFLSSPSFLSLLTSFVCFFPHFFFLSFVHIFFLSYMVFVFPPLLLLIHFSYLFLFYSLFILPSLLF